MESDQAILLTDPNVVLVILLVGLWASVLAVYIPGTGLWEVAALAILAGALYLLLFLPTKWTAVLALVAGTLDFLILPLYRQRLTALAGAGVLLQVAGSMLLFDGLWGSWLTIAAGVVMSLAFYRFVLIPAQMTRFHPSAPRGNNCYPVPWAGS